MPHPRRVFVLAVRFSLASQAFWVGAGLDFQGMGVYPSDVCFGADEVVPVRPLVIVRMSPPSYPWAWLLPSRAALPFHLARRL